VCVCVRARVCVYVCVCVRVRARARARACVCVGFVGCVFACCYLERTKEGEIQRQVQREGGERDRERESVCVCLWESLISLAGCAHKTNSKPTLQKKLSTGHAVV